jgi:phospholipid-binding lipoprotein MlaA
MRDFLDNLGEPVIFINDSLQGEFSRANTTAGRFLFNSTFGIGGLWDQASKIGMEKQSGDFGQTLYSWGVPDGPYLVLPILGPSNPRDAIGLGVDSYMDPFWWGLTVHYGATSAGFYRWIAKGIDERSRNIESLAEIERTSLDFYATVRSLARQRRAAQIRHQKEDVPNAAPLQGASALPAPAPRESVAALPAATTPAMAYRMIGPQAAQPATSRPAASPSPAGGLADLQKSSMSSSAASGR